MRIASSVRGLLFSQVGYDPSFPVRIVVRAEHQRFLEASAICRLTSSQAEPVERTLVYWGELWGSHWWRVDFAGDLQEGVWQVEVFNQQQLVLVATGLVVRRNILQDSTLAPMAAEMLEIRAILAQSKSGWMDAGMMWQESNAHSSMLIGLLDVLEFSVDQINPELKMRIERQVVVGCDYLELTQRRAVELGNPEGALCHDVIGHEKDILPNDAFKAVVAWKRAVRLLPDCWKNQRESYSVSADKTLRWLENQAVPMGGYGLNRVQRGLPKDTEIPAGEWTTRDLVMKCWGQLEYFRSGDEQAQGLCADTARQIMGRQVLPQTKADGYFGYFREFDSTTWAETSWSHSIDEGKFGADAGGTFPNYLIPLVDMLKLWPNHLDAPRWHECLKNFTYGYLIPVCHANPFGIVPQGFFGKEGLLWFVGPMHGMNAIYGLTAALALELNGIFQDEQLVNLAYQNMQWIAGLNAGLTADAMNTGCVVYRTDIKSNEARPVSMICGVGNQVAGGWFGTRGVICNGFSVGAQFQFDTECTRANDGPFSFTDEDWIPHSAGWLSGLARLSRLSNVGC